MKIEYSYKGAPTLRRFSESDAFLRCVIGPFGSGKSSACAVEIVSRALAQPPGPDGIKRSRWIVVRNTYRQLSDATIRTFHQWLPPVHFGTYRQSDQSYTITGFENCEIQVLYRALDRSDHIANLLSLEVTGAWVNEAREVPWSIIEALMGRVGRYPSKREGGCNWYGLVLDSNPADTDSKLYKQFCETEYDSKYAELFMQPDGLGPNAENLDNLPGGQEYYKKMAIGKDKEWVKVYCSGQWGYVQEGRAVYPEYVDSAHCAEIKPNKHEPIYRGFDFGLTPSCVFVQLSPSGQLLVLDELVSESMGIDRFSDEVLEHSSQHYDGYEFVDIGDPAGTQRAQTDEKTVFQILHAKNIMIEPGLQSLAIRLESVRKPLTRLVLGKPGFQVHPRCKQLRKGFMGGYCYRRLQVSSERYTSVPDKNSYSHIHDSLQYVCTRLFGGGLTTRSSNDPNEGFYNDAPDHSRSDVTGY